MVRKKKETYYQRWLEKHKQVRFYLKKEEYDFLERLASKHNLTVKDFILRFVQDLKKAVEGERKVGFEEAVNLFINDPKILRTCEGCVSRR